MIDFRYHIVSIVAIFFALGAGVLLGAGPLKNTGADLVQAQAEHDRAELQQKYAELSQANALAKYRDDYINKVTGVLVTERLKNRRIAIVTMPQADGGLVSNLSNELQDAGAQVTTRVSLDSKLFAPEQRPLLDPLVNELVTADVTFGKDSTTYQRAGQILARGIGAAVEGQAVDENATRILSGLTDSKLFGVKPTPKDRASLIVVVAAKPTTPAPDDSTYAATVDLIRGLDQGSAGVVVAGTPDSAQDGLLKTLRSDSDATKEVSSVDVADIPSGRATVVFALAEQAEGKSGQYGGVDAKDGVAPKAVLVPTN